MNRLSKPQLALLRRLPDLPTDGMTVRRAQLATARALVERGLALRVRPFWYARTEEGSDYVRGQTNNLRRQHEERK